MDKLNNLIFIDCEANGKCPSMGKLTEFGAAAFPSKKTFHGVVIEKEWSKENPAIRVPTGKIFDEKEVFENFEKWILEVAGDRPKFVSDNPAFDWQWINDGFWRTLGRNPFGYSAR